MTEVTVATSFSTRYVRPEDYDPSNPTSNPVRAPGKYTVTANIAGVTTAPIEIEILPEKTESTDKIEVRLQSNGFGGGYQWMGFELRNNSSDQMVSLGRSEKPVEIIVDNVSYVWTDPIVTGFPLPVSKPGEQSKCQFKLDEHWMPMKTISGPDMLKLKPGKHTIQAIVYAATPNEDPLTTQLNRVASNPVEIEIPPAQDSTKK